MGLYPYQEMAVEKITERKSLLVAYEMGLGKAIYTNSRVITPTGWSYAKDIAVGDDLVGRGGQPTKVLGVYPQEPSMIYEVTFADGATSLVNGEHVWTVQRPADSARDSDRWVTKTTLELLDDLYDAAGNRKWRIPMLTGPVCFQSAGDLPLDPYTLGVVLGDGHIASSTRANISTDKEILEAIGARNIKAVPGCYEGTASLPEELGLSGRRSWDKFIPEGYLRATPEARLALLQGLLDTDGSPIQDGGVEFATSSGALIDAVIDLVQGLGGIARNKSERVPSYTYHGTKHEGRPSWRVNIKLPTGMAPFRLQRKLDKWVQPTKYLPVRPIASIVPWQVGESVCFRVDAEDSLFVINDYVVTHNTPLTITAVERLMEDGSIDSTVLIVVLASLKHQWQAEIETWAPDSTSVVIHGTPKQRKEQYSAVVKDRPDYVIVNYEMVVRDFDLFFAKYPWGAIVCDEATAIKSFRSKRARAIKKLAKRCNVRIALTGTPIANGKPEEIFSLMEFVDPKVLGRFDLFDRTFIVRNRQGWPERYRNLPTLHKTLEPVMARKRQQDEDVAPYLPDVIEAPPDLVDFDRPSANLYRAIARDLLRVLDEAAELYGASWNFWSVSAHYGAADSRTDTQQVEMRGEIMTRIQALRLLCSHPDALRVSAERFQESDGHMGSSYCALLDAQGFLAANLGTPKLDAVVQRTKDFLEVDERNKLVLFSSFRTVIPHMLDRLSEFNPQPFHGGMNEHQKELAKRVFQTNDECRILVSSDAGGFGVDLPQANRLINYDLPWSSSAASQRNSRIIRASSTWPSVRIERFLIRGSLEERQWEALNHKVSVAAAIIDSGVTDDRGNVLSTVSSLKDVLQASLNTVS